MCAFSSQILLFLHNTLFCTSFSSQNLPKIQTNLKIVEGKHVQYGEAIKWGEKKWGEFKWGEKTPNIITYDQSVNVGENIQAETEYLGIVSGRLIKQSFNLNGNIIIKEAVLK